MSDATKYHEPLNHPLTKHEHDLIFWLLDHPEEGNPANSLVHVNPWFLESDIPQLKAQLDALTVVSKCTCGCPTVDFAIEGIAVPKKGEHILRDCLATVDGEEVGVMLFQNEGRLSSLEVYSTAGTDKTLRTSRDRSYLFLGGAIETSDRPAHKSLADQTRAE